jgi:hypothetical protein
MPTVIERLVAQLQQTRGLPFQLEHHSQAMLLTLEPSPGRSQVVKISLREASGTAPAVIRLVSRACPARDHRIVREALKANVQPELGCLSLEDVDGSKAINVTYTLAADNVEFLEFLTALQNVSRYADVIEHRITGSDNY